MKIFMEYPPACAHRRLPNRIQRLGSSGRAHLGGGSYDLIDLVTTRSGPSQAARACGVCALRRNPSAMKLAPAKIAYQPISQTTARAPTPGR